MPRKVDLTGQVFGRLTALRPVRDAQHRLRWLCQCSCGNRVSILTGTLRYSTRSCGCAIRDSIIRRSTKHGFAQSRNLHPLYATWQNMRSRCENPKNKRWPNYGGRGIRVCENWTQFDKFLQDVGPRPSKKHSLDRIDNDGDYEPGNVRWATTTEQARNKSSSKIYEWAGMSMCLSEWCERADMPVSTVRARIKANWPFVTAISTPVGFFPNRHRLKLLEPEPAVQ